MVIIKIRKIIIVIVIIIIIMIIIPCLLLHCRWHQ